MGFQFGFESDTEEPQTVGNPLDAVQETVRPQTYTLEHFLGRLVGTRISFEQIEFPKRLYRREFFDVRHQLMGEDGDSEELQVLVGTTAEDVRNGVYEGGLKSWECCYDLMHRLQETDVSVFRTFVELGCGTALPSCLVLQTILHQNLHGVDLVLTDFNYEVLRLVSVPNLFLTWCLTVLDAQELERLQTRADVEGNVRPDEIDVTEQLVARFKEQLDSQQIGVSFVSGSWGRGFATQLDRLVTAPTLAVSSETIYSPQHLPVVAQLITDLTRTSSCRSLVAAKDIYFGVGGSVTEFLRCLDNSPVNYSVEKINAGVQRSLILSSSLCLCFQNKAWQFLMAKIDDPPQDSCSLQQPFSGNNSQRRPKNLKNLQLDLSKNQTKYPVPLTYSANGSRQILSHSPASPRSPRLYRTPSLNAVLMSTANSPTQQSTANARGRSLTLTINSTATQPPRAATSAQHSLESANSLQFASSTSGTSGTSGSSTGSSGCLGSSNVSGPHGYNTGSVQNAYPQGPVCVLDPNLYLYSEPSITQLIDFDVIINVAQEITDYTTQMTNKISISGQTIQYYYIPWTHTSKLVADFPKLTQIIDDALAQNKRVLIHCQCGVSRSASLILAYMMKSKKIGYNEAYNLLKQRAPLISPNFALIYEVMEWGRHLGYSPPASPSNDI
ncbi:hypothetical protein OGAPHI_002935 [Ogataea philodendri]|uniref:protein-tyrosine-phosphatase n=1 Tax=Ogataea philodendri TaxID=1378263 RepID=A0A9P8P8W9_9ASCO|nr:uncharacterized protein OGAPHI_002935 [Ogataea philodendri]KAH3667286.1 hypothetical protein OGAPHI_002935 [Ogataea philodendri]